MKYKIGDKVKIKENLIIGKLYDETSFTSSMTEYSGNNTEVIDIICGTYKLKIDNGYWFWTDEMLEDINYINDNVLSDIDRFIIIKDIESTIQDVNPNEIISQIANDNLTNWCNAWRNHIQKELNSLK